jgi:hypothetical protein
MTVVGPTVPVGTDENGVLAAVFDEANQSLRTTTVTGTATGEHIGNDQNFVWSFVFDHQRTLRVIEV